MTEIILTGNDATVASAIVQVNSTIALHLAEIPGTGYRWSIQFSDPTAAELIDSFWSSDPNAGIGATGVRRFRFAIHKEGKHRVGLALRREWEPEHLAIAHRQLLLQVIPA